MQKSALGIRLIMVTWPHEFTSLGPICPSVSAVLQAVPRRPFYSNQFKTSTSVQSNFLNKISPDVDQIFWEEVLALARKKTRALIEIALQILRSRFAPFVAPLSTLICKFLHVLKLKLKSFWHSWPVPPSHAMIIKEVLLSEGLILYHLRDVLMYVYFSVQNSSLLGFWLLRQVFVWIRVSLVSEANEASQVHLTTASKYIAITLDYN